MHTELKHLTETQQADLHLFVEKITKAITVNKIICYSIRTNDAWNWFALPVHQQQRPPYRMAVDLLIIPNKEEKRPNADILQLVEKLAAPHLRCACIVRPGTAIDKALADRHLFYSRLFAKGLFLFGSREAATIPLQPEPSTIDYLEKANEVWKHHFAQANKFRITANWLLEGCHPESAIFYLHQATEQTAMALMHALTGYRPNSHNLPYLLALVEHLGLNSTSIFSPKDPEANELFNLLKNSYIDSRYKDNYEIKMEPVETLYDKVQLLMNAAEKVYQQQIAAWQEETNEDSDPPNDGGAISISPPELMRQAS